MERLHYLKKSRVGTLQRFCRIALPAARLDLPVPLSSHPRLRLLALAGLVVLSACSSEKKTFVARNWHNLLAYYNGYFLGREKVKEVEETTWRGMKDDYNKPLAVLPPPSAAASQGALLEEAVKKASVPIQRHKNSDWVDNSYLVIGKARFYQDDYENAIHTFRWLNAKSKEDKVKHAALVWLLRTYTDQKEYTNARTATEAILQLPLDKENARDYYLFQASYHQRLREWPEVLGYVEEALPLMRRNLRRGRMEFLAGQLRQRLGNDPEALAHYKYVLKCKPPYELAFNAGLAIAQVTPPTDEKGVRKIQKFFKRQLKDEKNTEYKDKIYYEMARFELKQSHVDLSIEYSNKSLRAGGASKGLKGLAYLNLGQIYYEKLRKYATSKLYYDSAVNNLDSTEENYKQIVRRQKVLAEFVKEYEVIEREDSLRRLVAMDSVALRGKLVTMATAKVRADAEASRKAEREARRAEREAGGGGGDNTGLNNAALQNTAGGSNPPGGGGATPPPSDPQGWYFYNQTLMVRGQALFKRKWGRRILEDNWRRSTKEANAPGDEDATAGAKGGAKADSAKGGATAQGGAAGQEGKPKDEKKEDAPAPTEEQAVATLVYTYRQGLPLTQDAIASSDKKLQVALFNIGRIYDQKLEETHNGIVSFSRVGRDYPDYEKTPEALFNLYQIFGRQKDARRQDSVKAVLLQRYPETVFAKLTVNPNYLIENKAATEAAKVIYKQAYENYQVSRYIEATQQIRQIRAQYPDNSFRDRVDLLAAMLVGKTVDANTYKDSLQAILVRYPKTDLKPTIEQMMAVATRFARGSEAGPAVADSGQAGPATATPWHEGIDGPQTFVAVIPIAKLTEDQAKQRLSDFNRTYFPQDNLTTAALLLNEKLMLVTARQLRSKLVGKYYLQKQEGLEGAFDDLDPRVTIFIMSQENYQLLYRTKDVAGYKRFFERAYKN